MTTALPDLFTVKLNGRDLVVTGSRVVLTDIHLTILSHTAWRGTATTPLLDSPQLAELRQDGLMDGGDITVRGRRALQMAGWKQ